MNAHALVALGDALALHPSLRYCYFFFPGPPGLACDAANGDTGTPAFGLGCLGFFGSLLLLSCPLAIEFSWKKDCVRTAGPIQLAGLECTLPSIRNALRAGKTRISKFERNGAGVKR